MHAQPCVQGRRLTCRPPWSKTRSARPPPTVLREANLCKVEESGEQWVVRCTPGWLHGPKRILGPAAHMRTIVRRAELSLSDAALPLVDLVPAPQSPAQ
eukprot:366573-Chlamydomonas_euryale.AAC.36